MKKRPARRKKMYFEVIFVGGVGDGEVRTGGGVHRRFQIWESVHWRFWFMDIMAVLIDFLRQVKNDLEKVVKRWIYESIVGKKRIRKWNQLQINE